MHFTLCSIDLHCTQQAVRLSTLLLSICGVTKLSDPSYENLVKLVREHFHSRRSEIVQCFHFISRLCQLNETIADFVAELSKLSEFYNFENKMDKLLRDRIVCGISHPAMLWYLLSETDLPLAKTLEGRSRIRSS